MTIEQILDSELLKNVKGAEEIKGSKKNDKKNGLRTIKYDDGREYIGEIVDG